MNRNLTTQLYQAFLAAAQTIVGTNGFPETADGLRVHVEPTAAVSLVEDGAFVDALIWVPREFVTDTSGRVIAPPQAPTPERPHGIWDANRDAREPVKE